MHPSERSGYIRARSFQIGPQIGPRMPEPIEAGPAQDRAVARVPAALHDLLFDRYADAVLVADGEGRYVEANLAAATLLGYPRAELLEMRITDLLVFSERGEAEFARFTAEGYWRGAVELRRKDGSTVLVEARATMLETAEGTWGVSIMRESGEPLQAALAASEAQFEAIVQSSEDAIFSGDTGGRIWTWNGGAERIFGFTAAEAIGQHVSLIAPPERRHEVDDNIRRVIGGEPVRESETTRMAKDGRRVQVSLSVSPIRGAGGEVTGIAAIARDVTEQREAERRAHILYELTHLLGRATSQEGVFVASLDALQRALHTDRASILLFDDERVMRFRAWRGLSPRYRAAVERHNPWAPDDLDPQPIHVPDASADDSLREVGAVIRDEGIRSLSFIPLLHLGELFGKVMLYFDAPRMLGEIDLQLATSIASQTAFAIARLRTEAALAQARAQLELITIGSADGLTIQDEHGRVVYANEAAARLSGFESVDEFLAGATEYRERWELLSIDGWPFEPDRLPGRRALSGELHPEATLHIRDRRTGLDHWRQIRAEATEGVDGIRYAINLFHDVTEQRRSQDQLRFQAALLLAQAEASVEGILVVDTTGKIVSWNARFARMWDIPEEVIESRSDEAAIGSVLAKVADPDGFVQRIEELYANPETEASDEIDLLDGRLFERVSKPLVDESQAHRGRIWFFRDATEERRREAAQRLLAEAGKVLASSFDDETGLQGVLDLSCAWNADIAALYLADGDGVRLVGIRHREPALQAIGDEVLERHPSFSEPSHPAVAAVTQDRSVLVNDISAAYAVDVTGGGPVAELARRADLTSAIVVPIRSRGAVLGALSIGRSAPDRRYDDTDVAVLEELAERIALTFDNSRLYRERDFIAHTLQTSLLPTRMPDVEGIEIVAEYRAAGEGIEVGGDFYDLFAMQDGSWAVAVGDVCGKGPTAAAMTGVARHTMRAGAMMDASPSRVLALVNEAILRDSPEERFCTILLARLTRQEDRTISVLLSSGGHPPALVLRAAGSVEEIDEPGTLLGLFDDPHLPEAALELAPGDSMILYTDGVTDEQLDGEEFGETRLHDLVRECRGWNPTEIAQRIVAEVETFSPGPPRDDIAVVVLRATG